MLSPAFLDELRARTTLSTLIGRTLKITRAGREWKGCCPFHNEKTPSFYVNDEKGFYHCFGCSAHGDAIRWMTDQRGLSFIDAVKDLAAEAGMEVPAADPRAAEKAKARDGLIDINSRAAEFFQRQLSAHRDAVDYLERRGISGASVSKFGIGFALRERIGDPSRLLSALQCQPSTAVDLGLMKKAPDGQRHYDFFRGRIIIPIHDARGGVIGFGGRILGQGEPKYLNSPDTPVFDKGRTLFNLHRASAPARAKNRLLIVEGYMDVIGLDAVGFDTAVAPNGTALTDHQLFLAWKLVDVPVICFDGDNAGRKAAARAAYRAISILEPGKGLQFAALPEGKDPDDLAREKGLEAINEMVDSALPLIDIIWRDLNSRFAIANPDQRAAMSAEIKSILAGIRNQDVREAYREALLALFRRTGQRQRPISGSSRNRPGGVAVAVEAALALGVVDFPGVIDGQALDVTRFSWKNDENFRLVKAIYDAGNDLYGEKITRKMALEAVEKAGLTEYVAEMRRFALRMPFSAEKSPDTAEIALAAALRDNFNRGDRN